MKEENVYLRSR